MRLYKDAACTEPIEELDLGDSWFLESKTVKVWLFNESKEAVVDISIDAGKDVSVRGPDVLRAGEKAPVIFTWKPRGFDDVKRDCTIDAKEVTKEMIKNTLENPPQKLTREEISDLFSLTLPAAGMQLYEDEALTQQLQKGFDNDPRYSGASTLKVWVLNTTDAFMRDVGVDVDAAIPVKVEAPRTLKSLEKALIIFTWQPPALLKDLKLKVTMHAVEVYEA